MGEGRWEMLGEVRVESLESEVSLHVKKKMKKKRGKLPRKGEGVR